MATETRAGGQTVSANSNGIAIVLKEWTVPGVTMPPSLTLRRGEAVSARPTVTSAQGSLAYKLQAYVTTPGDSSCGWTEQWRETWRDLESSVAYCTSGHQ